MKFKNHLKNFDKEQILKLNKEGKNIKEISKIINIPTRRLGEMCTYFNVEIIRNFTIPVNHNYFNMIDNEVKAYILGYIIADGCIQITKRKNNYSKRLCFCSSVDDREVIELIKNEISKESLLQEFHYTKGAVNRKKQLRLRITSNMLIDDLVDKYDIIPNKTINGFNFKLPQIDNNLIRHLIRGIFDGDGYIGKTAMSFSLNSKFLCEDIKKEFQKNIPESTFRIYEIQGKTCKYYELNVNLGKGVKSKMKEYLYKDSNYFLNRKFIKF